MATWKKVIVSGSNAELNQITASGGVNATLPNIQQANFVTFNTTTGQFGYFNTGSLTATTASYVTSSGVNGPFGANSILTASYATTASFVTQAVSASFATLAQTANTASTVTVTDTTSGGTHFLAFTIGSSGAQTLRVDSNGPTVNASQNSISATSFTGSLSGTATSASYVVTAQTASYVNGNIFTSANPATSASYALSSSLASTVTTNANLTGDVTSAGNITTLATVASAGTTGGSTAIPVITINAKGLTTSITTAAVVAPAGTLTGATLASNVLTSSLTSVGTLSSLTATNAVITNNLTVQGTASFQNTTNLEVADRFVLFASGSNTTGDGGIVIQQGTQNIGELFAYENSVNRWGFTSSFNASSPSYTAAAYITTTEVGASSPTAAPIYGGSGNGAGNIYVTTGGDIFIYA